MKIIIILVVGVLAGGVLMMFFIGKDMEKRIVRVLSPDDYCRSVGYDFAEKKDFNGIPRVKCAYSRSGINGKIIQGYAWYQYPSKTDLENYCGGDLKKSATILIP